jgi:hypothetical protein
MTFPTLSLGEAAGLPSEAQAISTILPTAGHPGAKLIERTLKP